MTHLTYWYGESKDLRNAYSFQKTSTLISYESGLKKTEKRLNLLKQKHSVGKKLLAKDLKFLKSFEEMEADRPKDPIERHGYVDSEFLEEYHMTLEEMELAEKVKKTKKTKNKTAVDSEKKKGKKIVKKKKGATEAVENEETPKKVTKKIAKKVTKKRSKKDESSAETSRPKKKVKNVKEDIEKEQGTKKTEDTKPSAYEEFAALDEVSSHGGTDDGSLEMDELHSDDDSADEDYVVNPKSKTSKKKVQKPKVKTKKSKEPPKKKVKKTKIKVETKIGKERKNTDNSKILLKKEQKKFHTCEVKFLPLLRRWEQAIRDENVTKLSSIYEELLTSMEHFTAPFIREYDMSSLMKRSKGYDNEKRKKVLSKFKSVYAKKKDEAPDGFKPVRESEKYVPIEMQSGTAKKKQKSKEDVGVTDISHTPQDTQKPANPLTSARTQNSELTEESKSEVMAESSTQRNIKKQEMKPNLSSLKRIISGTKPEKKKSFSLTNLMRAGSSSSQSGNTGTKQISSLEDSSAPSSRSAKSNKTKPSWTLQVLSNKNVGDENRVFGLEFLQQAALYIPESKSINNDAVARNIELAIYNWTNVNLSGEDERWKKYWGKIHDLVASISGKHQGGTLAKMIVDGEFSTPDELVRLDDDDLWCSFQGLSLKKFGK